MSAVTSARYGGQVGVGERATCRAGRPRSRSPRRAGRGDRRGGELGGERRRRHDERAVGGEAAAVVDPLAGTLSSAQYEAAAPDSWRWAKSPVISNVTGVFEDRSRSLTISPTCRLSSAAAVAGSAAGIAPAPARRGARPGHVPDTSTACASMPSSDAASSSGVFPPRPAGRAGSAPGTRPSGSDQVPCQKPNGTPGSAEPIADRRASVVVRDVGRRRRTRSPSARCRGATARSCRTVCGSACPANAASAAATAAATSVVSAAAAITTQCAVMRRAGRGPRGANTSQRIPYVRNPGNSPL